MYCHVFFGPQCIQGRSDGGISVYPKISLSKKFSCGCSSPVTQDRFDIVQLCAFVKIYTSQVKFLATPVPIYQLNKRDGALSTDVREKNGEYPYATPAADGRTKSRVDPMGWGYTHSQLTLLSFTFLYQLLIDFF